MNDDRRLQDVLGELTRRQGQSAPSFAQMLEPKRRNPRSRIVLALSTAAAACLLLIAGIALTRSTDRSERTLAQCRQVTNWTAPTDVFLPSMAGIFSSRVPPLGDVGLDIYTGGTSSPAQNERITE